MKQLRWVVIGLVWLELLGGAQALAGEPIALGTRRELFVDRFLIGETKGDLRLELQRPVPKEVVLVTDAPWEGNTCAYFTVFQDGDLYRMYYRGSHWDERRRRSTHREVTCYAESRDGIHWTKPKLGLFEFGGSKANNIVWDGIGTHNFVVFKDANPDAPADARYKAIAFGRRRGQRGLYVFKSPDGIHWSLIVDRPVITKGTFDSQNVAFWDPVAGLYREYHRTSYMGRRWIMTGTSRDFVHWTEPRLIETPGAPLEHLYTNAVMFYPRAPHILIGFPTRFLPEEGSSTEPTFMSSRDGMVFHRWLEPVIPRDAPEDRSGNRSNYMAWGLVQLPGDERHYSVYATEAYYRGPSSRLRRFEYRVDGFVAAEAGRRGGTLVTRLFTHGGEVLRVNFKTRRDGYVRVGLVDANGRPVAGFALSECEPLRGDEIDGVVRWRRGADVSSTAGKPLRLVFDLRNAQVFSFRFAPSSD